MKKIGCIILSLSAILLVPISTANGIGYILNESPLSKHNIELEVGRSDGKGDQPLEIIDASAFEIEGDFSITPISLSYRYKRNMSNTCFVYASGGLGGTYLKSRTETSGSRLFKEDELILSAQWLVGLGFRLDDACRIYSGYRLIFFDETGSAMGIYNNSQENSAIISNFTYFTGGLNNAFDLRFVIDF